MASLTEILPILPENLISRIQQAGQNAKIQKWQMGDDVLEIYAHFVVNQIPCNLLDAAWVAHVLTGGEKSQNTLRQYALVSQFYPVGVRVELHHDELPYSHFVYAMGMGEKWRDVLTKSHKAMLENGGRPISLESLRLSFFAHGPSDTTNDFYAKTIQPPDASRTPVLGRFGEFSDVQGQRQNALNRIAELIGEIKGLLPALQDKPGLARVLGGLVLSAGRWFEAEKDGLLVDETVFDQTIDAHNNI